MSEYKYPLIPKQYYPAVMFACKMIRDNGYFHKAINSAAKYYKVNPIELEKHVRARQGAGQKGKTRKYTFFSVLYVEDYVVAGDEYASWGWFYIDDALGHAHINVIEATNEANVKSRLRSMEHNDRHGTGNSYTLIHAKPFSTKKEAEEYSWTREEVIELIRGKYPLLKIKEPEV